MLISDKNNILIDIIYNSMHGLIINNLLVDYNLRNSTEISMIIIINSTG
jgi:hypothetical protein